MLSHISFASIPVTDLDRALAFWRDVMGLVVTTDSDAIPGMRWIMLEMPGARTRLHLDKVETIPEANKPTLPLIASDVVGFVETLRSRGVDIVGEPKPAEWDAETIYALIRDTEGNVVLIASR